MKTEHESVKRHLPHQTPAAPVTYAYMHDGGECVQKTRTMYHKRPRLCPKRPRMCQKRPRMCQKRPDSVKRDQIVSKETQTVSKETKNVSKENKMLSKIHTHVYKHAPIHVQRDQGCVKEVVYMYVINMHIYTQYQHANIHEHALIYACTLHLWSDATWSLL